MQKRDENPLVPVPQPANGTAPPPPPSAADVESTKPRTGVVAGAPKPWPNDGPSVAAALDYCSTTITPDCLRALYGFPIGSLAKYGIIAIGKIVLTMLGLRLELSSSRLM